MLAILRFIFLPLMCGVIGLIVLTTIWQEHLSKKSYAKSFFENSEIELTSGSEIVRTGPGPHPDNKAFGVPRNRTVAVRLAHGDSVESVYRALYKSDLGSDRTKVYLLTFGCCSMIIVAFVLQRTILRSLNHATGSGRRRRRRRRRM